MVVQPEDSAAGSGGGFLLLVGGALIAEPFYHRSIGWWGVLMQVSPIVLTVWTFWLIVCRKASVFWRLVGSVLVVAPVWA